MSERELLDAFGETFIHGTRDRSLSEWFMFLEGRSKAPDDRKLYEELKDSFSDEQVTYLRKIIPYVVDTALAYFLFTIMERDELSLCIADESGKLSELRDISDGLAHEIYNPDGWIDRFSEYPETARDAGVTE
jgi:hypothetical protein